MLYKFVFCTSYNVKIFQQCNVSLFSWTPHSTPDANGLTNDGLYHTLYRTLMVLQMMGLLMCLN